MSRARRGFTLVELLVAVLLVAVAVSSVMGGLRAVAAADVKAKEADVLQSLAFEKAHDVLATETASTASGSGNFSDQGYPKVTWTADVQASGTEDIDQLTVEASSGSQTQKVTCLFYVRPTTGTTTTE